MWVCHKESLPAADSPWWSRRGPFLPWLPWPCCWSWERTDLSIIPAFLFIQMKEPGSRQGGRCWPPTGELTGTQQAGGGGVSSGDWPQLPLLSRCQLNTKLSFKKRDPEGRRGAPSSWASVRLPYSQGCPIWKGWGRTQLIFWASLGSAGCGWGPKLQTPWGVSHKPRTEACRGRERRLQKQGRLLLWAGVITCRASPRALAGGVRLCPCGRQERCSRGSHRPVAPGRSCAGTRAGLVLLHCPGQEDSHPGSALEAKEHVGAQTQPGGSLRLKQSACP